MWAGGGGRGRGVGGWKGVVGKVLPMLFPKAAAQRRREEQVESVLLWVAGLKRYGYVR